MAVYNPADFTLEELTRFHDETVEQVAEDHAYHDGPQRSWCPLCATTAGERTRRMNELDRLHLDAIAGVVR